MQSKTKNPYIKAFADEFNGPQTNQGPYTRFQANLNVNQFCHIGADKTNFNRTKIASTVCFRSQDIITSEFIMEFVEANEQYHMAQ